MPSRPWPWCGPGWATWRRRMRPRWRPRSRRSACTDWSRPQRSGPWGAHRGGARGPSGEATSTKRPTVPGPGSSARPGSARAPRPGTPPGSGGPAPTPAFCRPWPAGSCPSPGAAPCAGGPASCPRTAGTPRTRSWPAPRKAAWACGTWPSWPPRCKPDPSPTPTMTTRGRFSDRNCRDTADQILAGAAQGGMGLRDLAELAAEMQARSQPDPDDDDPGKVFEDRTVRLATTFGGAGVLTGDVTPECAAVLTTVLDALSAPRGAQDTRSHEQRYHDALEEAMRRLVTAGLLPERAGQPAKVIAHISLTDLLDLDTDSVLQKEWAARVHA